MHSIRILVLFLLAVFFSAHASAGEKPPLRVACVPIIVLSGCHMGADELKALERRLGYAVHVPLNGVIHSVEYLPPSDCRAALDEIMSQLRKTNRKARLMDAMEPLSDRLDADLVICPVVERYFQYASMGMSWRGETLWYSNARISLMGYERKTGRPFCETESRFYRGDSSAWGRVEVLAGECLDKVIERTGIWNMVHPPAK